MRFNNTEGKTKKAISKLYGDRAREYEKRYALNKKIAVFLILLLTATVTIYSSVKTSQDSELINGKYIGRSEKDGTDKHISLKAVSSEGYSKDLNLTIKSRQYTETELDELFPDFKEKLLETIVPKGESLNGITSDMTLADTVLGYPFLIKWQSDKPLLLSSEGKINRDRLSEQPEDAIVILTATVTYEEFYKELQIPVSVKAEEKSKESIFWENVETAIETMSIKTASEAYQILPTDISGQTLFYEETKSSYAVFLGLMGILTAFLWCAKKDEELQKKALIRDEQLKRDYPQFINRIALYYGAGLSVKNVWQKICRDYERQSKTRGAKRRVVYEEMIRCEKRMQDGMGEEDAYEKFASAVGIMEYTTLIGILQQAVKTGGSDISNTLRERRLEAYEEQKKTARILGEKAGTKLLLPMFMMLTVVLIIILIPAFVSF